MISASIDLAVNAGLCRNTDPSSQVWVNGVGEALLGQSQEGAETPSKSSSSGLLNDLHTKGLSGKPPPLLQLASCRGRWPDLAPGSQILGCKEVRHWKFFPVLPLMAKKRKSVATRLDEVDRTMYSTFCSAANSLSQLYTQAMSQQKVTFQAGERHAMVGLVKALYPFCLCLPFCSAAVSYFFFSFSLSLAYGCFLFTIILELGIHPPSEKFNAHICYAAHGYEEVLNSFLDLTLGTYTLS
ncbi:hypothetical protein Taro_009262 [Colocasia esculenta]|uniref:Uncharacterized protein n=1 Tax=Colocasia esculenta TaxID=4460 RepID=A0A843U3I8_COLES|nr:hypothetical protein [Colocasia esculenta]